MLFLFDIDGTLIRCQGAGRRALNHALLPHLGPDGLDGVALDGKTDPLILDEAFRRRLGRAPSSAESDTIAAGYFERLAQEVLADDVVQVLPGVAAALDLAAAHVQDTGVVTLATGNWRRGARLKLARVGLWERFQTEDAGGFGCDAAERGALVRMARERGERRLRRALDRAEVLVIGDTPHDVSAAHAAGATAITVTTGAYDADALRRAGADAVFADLLSAVASVCRRA